MKKMTRKLIAGTAMVATAAVVAACGKDPATTVYGPPEYFSQEEATEQVTTEKPDGVSFETTEAENYDPSLEVNEDVYGPPEDFEPSGEINVDVYGPPEIEDPGKEINVAVYGPPEDFDPTREINEDVYGPPEDFD